MLINGITVTADQTLTTEEISALVDEEIQLWKKENKTLGFLDLTISGDEIVIKGREKSSIRRVRRITGYLSELANFNPAKRDECLSRVIHTA